MRGTECPDRGLDGGAIAGSLGRRACRQRDGCGRSSLGRGAWVAMEDPYELALAMLGVVLAAIMLVAGEFYLVSTPKSPQLPISSVF